MIAPFYLFGKHAEHIHVTVFIPAMKEDGTYYGPPSGGWGYSPSMALSTDKDLRKYGTKGVFVDPEVFFTEYRLTDDVEQ